MASGTVRMSETGWRRRGRKRARAAASPSQARVGVLQIQELPARLAGFAILRQVAAGLAHQPQRGVFGRLLQRAHQEGIVLGSARSGSAKIIERWDYPLRTLVLDQEMIKPHLRQKAGVRRAG